MASYNPPNPYVPGAFNPTQFITPSDNITTKYLDENYLRFPFAQGPENFVSINNQGSLSQGGLADFTSATTPAIFNLPPTITNPIANTATTPSNAVATIGYVLANEQGGGDLLPLNNPWTGVNNFNPTPNQVYGSVMNTGITLTNNQNNATPQGDTDIISYTPTSNKGLCIYSLASSNTAIGASPQLQLFPDGGLSVLSAQATNGIAELNATGTGGKVILQSSAGVKLQVNPLINFNDLGNLTGNSTGISSSVNLTAPSITTPLITQTANNTDITVLGSGLNSNIILDSTAGVSIKTNPVILFDTYGTLNGDNTGLISSVNFTVPSIDIGSGVNQTTITSYNHELTITSNVILPPQTTYTPSASYANTSATQQFVQLAVASQGSGDVTLAGTNNFTGTNTFNTNVPTSTVSQTYPSTSSTNFATIAYVNSLASPTSTSTVTGGSNITYWSTNGISSNYIGNTTFFSGFIYGFVPTANTFSFNINTTIPGPTFSIQLTNATLYNISTQASWGMSSSILTNTTLTVTFTATLDAPYSFNLTFSGNTY